MLYSPKKELNIMPKTISFHNGTTWSRGHNIRDERYTSKQEHIDKTLTEQNVTIRDVPVRKAYEEIFGQAVEEYNAKQKRSDRRITDYYNKIKQDKRKHPVYECIVQIGDRSDTGNSAELEKQALIRFAEEWDKRNPNLYLIGAYIHADEPDGTVHLHLDYIPIAQCNRGMSIQNSLDRALQQQGFKSENIHQTAQIEWQDSEREALCIICRELNIDVQRNQGIGKGREYLTANEYKRAKEEQQEQINQELQPLQKAVTDAQNQLKKLEGRVLKQSEVNAIKGKKSITGALKGVTYEEYLSLKKTAKQVNEVQATNKTLTIERNEARERAKNAEEHARTAHMTATKRNADKLAELSNQTRILKQALGISPTADYDEIRHDLQSRGLLQQNSHHHKHR